MSNKVVIIGGVATGPKTAARLRRLDSEAEITVIERQDLLSYAGCGMPYYIENIIEEWNELLGGASIRDAAYFKANRGFTVLDQTEVKKINRDAKTVTIEDLRTGEVEDMPYDKLVLGTGASPFVPRMEGTELKGVHRLYNPHHAKAIKTEVDMGAKNVVIVGGGLIGIESCGAFVTRGCNVSVVEMMPTIVPNLLDPEMGYLLENYLTGRGVNLVKGSPVAKMIDDGTGKIKAVETADGRVIDADLVVVAIGVRPNTQLAVDAGIELGPTRAIAVNENMQTSDPDIYAGGDCVESTHLVTGEKVYAPLGSTANKHGRIIADNIAGRDTTFQGINGTAVFKVLDWNCGTTGISEKKAKELGYDVVTTLAPRGDFSGYIPGNKRTIIKLIADKENCKVLGCQVVGEGDGIKRIDVVATAMKFESNLKSIADLDLGYAPAYSTAIDAIQHAANVLRNKIQGYVHGINPIELKERLEGEHDFVLLDCRRDAEYDAVCFPDQRCLHIPVVDIKERVAEIPKGKEIIIFCATSIRAYNAERTLRGLGYTDVKILDGSLAAWPFPDFLTA
jgi:NADPH-dependent 2,4-dienoyl-CoA reductase/sulfur reductase-like enzyme/rhodanese-related sulfurtransferase